MLLRWKTQNCDSTIQMLQHKLRDRTRPDRAQCLFQAFPVHSRWDCAEFSLGVSLFAERSENEGFCDARARLLGTATIQCCNALPHLPFSFWCSCATAWPCRQALNTLPCCHMVSIICKGYLYLYSEARYFVSHMTNHFSLNVSHS